MAVPSCLLVVDVQNGFIGPATEKIPGKIRDFCDASSIEHRVFTRFINPGTAGPFERIMGWSRLRHEDETNLAPEVAKLPTHVVDKYTYSPFVGGGLECTLRELEVSDVMVCGIDTDVCVLTTAVGLFDRGFWPLVVADLSMSHAGSEFHDAALKILPRYIGADNIMTADELLHR